MGELLSWKKDRQRIDQISILKNRLSQCRFVKLRSPPQEKKPLEKEWTTNTSNTFDTYNPLSKDTYGILCGYDNLFVVDFDSKEVMETILKENAEIFDTFQVRTALKGLLHCYFYATDISPMKKLSIKDEFGKTIIDIQGIGSQVLGPGSMIAGKMYIVKDDVEIKRIEYVSLCNKLKEYGSKRIITQPIVQEKTRTNYSEEDLKVHKEMDKRLTVQDVLAECGHTTDGNPGKCPFGHPSIGGSCFSYNESQWYCFNCERSGNALTLFAQLKGIKTKEAYVILKRRFGLKDAYDLRQEEKISNAEEKKENEKKKLMMYHLLPIKSFCIFKNKEDSTYSIKFDYDEEEVIIKMLPDNLLFINEFRVRYFNETGVLLPKIKSESWERILGEWDQYREIISAVSGTDEESVAVDTFLNDLNNYCVVIDSKQANASGRALMLQQEPEIVYVSTTNILNIVKKNQIKITIGKLRNLLNKYVIGKSKVINIGNKRSARFWAFKKDLLELEDRTLEQEESEESKKYDESDESH